MFNFKMCAKGNREERFITFHGTTRIAAHGRSESSRLRDAGDTTRDRREEEEEEGEEEEERGG
jgi:hypothetical protein